MRRQSADHAMDLRRAASTLLATTTLLGLAVLLWWLTGNAAQQLQVRGIHGGFDFLQQPAGFVISESWLALDSSAPYWQLFAAGLINTLRVALPALVLTTVIGMLLGAARLSRNGLLRLLATSYIETLRNIPLLLQLLAWYFVCTSLLPDASTPLSPLPHVYLSKGGLAFPALHLEGWKLQLAYPQTGHFDIEGGSLLSPEFMALLTALTLYTAAYIAEVVRSGLQSVEHDQHEAALLLGASGWQIFWRVVLPQALRAIIPPLTNQYLNLIKNSSLAVAIGYPDLVAVGNSALNQTGRAFECIAIILAVYLVLSLFTALLMARFNQRAVSA